MLKYSIIIWNYLFFGLKIRLLFTDLFWIRFRIRFWIRIRIRIRNVYSGSDPDPAKSYGSGFGSGSATLKNKTLCGNTVEWFRQQKMQVHIYRSTGRRSMFWTSTFCRSTALYINKNLLKYRTKCHLKMLCRSTALYINHCWSKNHFSFILFHRSIIILCLLCL